MVRTIRIVAAMWIFCCASISEVAAQQAPQTASTVVATVDGASITLGEVDRQALRLDASGYDGLSLGHALYAARKATLEGMIAARLIDAEATRLGMESAALIRQEVDERVSTPVDADIEAWFTINRSRLGNVTLDQVREPIRQLIARERYADAHARFVNALKGKTTVTVALEPLREVVGDAGRPSRGPANAPVQIIEFSDFQCPFCQRALPVLEQVMETYGDRVRLVYRHFPLSNHADARPAAEASLCAADQDRFWPYHDRLFANQSQLSTEALKQHAADLGLDTSAFNTCLDSRKHQAAVQEDLTAGGELGVSGTPAFFINRRLLVGSQPFSAFKEIIDEELGRVAP